MQFQSDSQGHSNPPSLAMSLRRAAEAVDVSQRFLWQEVRDGRLRASRAGRVWLVTPAAIGEWLASNEARTAGGGK
jgi:excisionase family DNA binding protein